MRSIIMFNLVMLCVIAGTYSQTQAVTSDGRKVSLNDDGTWQYVIEADVPIETDWTISTTTDPLTDETRTVLTVTATDGTARFGRPITLVLRKTGTASQMYINWGSFLGLSSDTQPVSYRIDQEPLVSTRMNISTNSEASFFSSQVVISTIREMIDADTLVARTTPYGENPKTVSFPISGLRSIAESTPHLSDWLDQ